MNNLEDYKYPEFNEQFPGMIPKDSSSGADIPTPTVEDEGKVLSVNRSGNPVWRRPNGGAFVVNFTAIDGNDQTTADKTPTEISAAAANGQVCVAFVAESDIVYYLYKSGDKLSFFGVDSKIIYDVLHSVWHYQVIQ